MGTWTFCILGLIPLFFCWTGGLGQDIMACTIQIIRNCNTFTHSAWLASRSCALDL